MFKTSWKVTRKLLTIETMEGPTVSIIFLRKCVMSTSRLQVVDFIPLTVSFKFTIEKSSKLDKTGFGSMTKIESKKESFE